MLEGRPPTRQSARRGRQRSYLVSTPLPEELLGGAPHLASTTNPHAPLPGYGYSSPAEPEQPHTKLVSLLEAGWMLDAWDKLPPPQQAPYVDAALAEMGHEAEPTAGRPCSAPASPPPLPRPRQAFPCTAASAAATAALAVPGVDGLHAAGAVAAPDGQDAAGGLLALSLLSSLAYPALLGNVQAPQDSCPGVACPSRGSTTGSGSSAATQLRAASRGTSHSSSASSPPCAAGIGETAAAQEAECVEPSTEQHDWQHCWQQQQQQQLEEWAWPPQLLQAVQATGGPELVLQLQTLLQCQWQQAQQEQHGSMQQPQQQQQQQQQQIRPVVGPQVGEPRPQEAQCWPFPRPHAGSLQHELADEVPHAPARRAGQPPSKRPALQAAAQAMPEPSLPTADETHPGGAAPPRQLAAGLQGYPESEAPLQRQLSGCSVLTRPGTAGPTCSGPAACAADDDGGGHSEGAAAAGDPAAATEEDCEEEEEGGCDGCGGSRRERKREPPRYRVKDVTLEVLQREGCFNMTQVEAARHLGFGSPTSIKAIMKRLGILKWPYRKKSTIGKMLGNMEEFVRRYCEPGIVDKVLQRAREAYRELEVYEKCTTGAPPPLAEELRALRQKVYKLKDQDKQGQSEDSMRRCVGQLVGRIMSDAAAAIRSG